MGLLRVITVRALTLIGVLFMVLIILVVFLGLTGLSDRLLNTIISEELRSLRQELSKKIRDPVKLEEAIESRREELVKAYGLDKPWLIRLPSMIWRVLSLDLGYSRTLRSFKGSSKVSEIVLERIPNTILLFTTASVITSVIGLLIGVKLSTRVGSRMDRLISYLSAISYATPTWWIAIILILIFSFQFRVFPFGGMYSAPPPMDPFERIIDLVWHSILPIITLVLVSLGPWIYSSRTMLMSTAQEDFVTVARAKGLPEKTVLNRYVVRVSAPPIVTSVILGLAGSLGGAILTETVFNWPGMGRLYYDAVLALDEPVIIALTFMYTLIYIIARFILEILYLVLDPRVRY